MQWLTSGLWDNPLDWDCHSNLIVVQLYSRSKKDCGSLLTNDFGVSDAIDEIAGSVARWTLDQHNSMKICENPANACPGLWIWSNPYNFF